MPHTNTDLDALGAAIGAQVLYPQAFIVLPGTPGPKAAEFLSLHRHNLRVRTLREVDLHSITRAVVVDTADPARLGPLPEVIAAVEVHLYDHHPPDLGDISGILEVRDSVGSTCTLMAEIIEESGAPLRPFQATALLLGIYADTGSLTLTGTTDRDARAAAFLLARGANLRVIARFLQVNLSAAQQRLLDALQTSARWLPVHGVTIRVAQAETPEYVGGLSLVVHRLQEILPAPAHFVVARMGDRVHLVARSELAWLNAAAVMAEFGGGGHSSAASAVVRGSGTGEVMARLEEALTRCTGRPTVARDVMSVPVKSIGLERSIREAERIMLRHGHSGMPVVNEAGQLQGILSLRHVEKAREHGLEHAPVKGIMTRRVVTAPPDMVLEQVQELIVERGIGRVPIVDGENLVGIISRSDLLGRLYGETAPRWHERLHTGSRGSDSLGLEGSDRLAEVEMEQAVSRLPEPLQRLLGAAGEVSEETGLPVYAVGGFVRDLLLGRPNLDLDLVVEGDGPAFARELARRCGGQVKEVERFAAAHIYPIRPEPGLPPRIDLSSARREYYEHAAALPLIKHADLQEDLYRRDFSINAMALRLGPHGPTGLTDFFGGLSDLRDGVVRILHTLSFIEDPTRVLRAVRFAERYGFRLEEETERLAAAAVRDGYLRRLSAERSRNELILILQEAEAAGALRTLQELGALQELLSGFQWDEATAGCFRATEEGALALPDLAAAASPWALRLLCLLHRLPPEQGRSLVGRLKLKRESAQPLLFALTAWREALASLSQPGLRPSDAVRALRAFSPEALLLLWSKGAAEPVRQYWRTWRHVRLELNGADLIALGIPAGPVVGRVLDRLLAERLDGELPDRSAQISRALWYAKEEA